MNDRELLEAAALAAGMAGWRWASPKTGMVKMIDPTRPETTGSYGPDWNPITNDGDAFRLAFALNMRVAVGQVDWMAGEYVGEFSEPSDVESDPLAATRRAIVCAAAKRWREQKKYLRRSCDDGCNGCDDCTDYA